MSDKMRAALFSVLGEIDGLSVLDAFAGSGALAFEAISRGASRALMLESDVSAQKTIARNIELLAVQDAAALVKAAAGAWLRTSNEEEQFDVIFCDPPYTDVQERLLSGLSSRVRLGGILVLSWPGHLQPPVFSGLSMVKVKSYGDSQLIFYRKTG